MSHMSPSVDPLELESLVRRVVHQELRKLLEPSRPKILDDWSQEGPEDPEGDEQLLREALATRSKYRDHPEDWIEWGDAEAELDRAEAAGELPD